jgi:hypothetical protein
MTVEKMEELFEKLGEDYSNKFEKIEHPIKTEFQREDLCAFVLLDRLIKSDKDIVSAAGHDQIWLGVELEELAKVATEEDIKFLEACGVFVSDESLSMFV